MWRRCDVVDPDDVVPFVRAVEPLLVEDGTTGEGAVLLVEWMQFGEPHDVAAGLAETGATPPLQVEVVVEVPLRRFSCCII